jgi:hypothetical protein
MDSFIFCFFILPYMKHGVSLARQNKPEEHKPWAVIKVKQPPPCDFILCCFLCNLLTSYVVSYLRVFKDQPVDGVVRII